MSDRTLVAGVDSSTQSTKIVVCDAQTGQVVRASRAPHPDGTEVHPDRWWEAYTQASGDGILDGVDSIAVGGQQHGMVTLDEGDEVVREALLWNDTRSAQAAADLTAELGGAALRGALPGQLVLPLLDRPAQPRVVPGGDGVEPQGERALEDGLELDLLVAPQARVGRFAHGV